MFFQTNIDVETDLHIDNLMFIMPDVKWFIIYYNIIINLNIFIDVVVNAMFYREIIFTSKFCSDIFHENISGDVEADWFD